MNETLEILSQKDARKILQEGIDYVANAVGATLGPMGRNVVIGHKDYHPVTTKDGVTVARSINPFNDRLKVGARLVQGVAAKTVLDSGDGTTTATILTQEMVKSGLELVNAGGNPVLIKRGIEKAVEHIVSELKSMSVMDISKDYEMLKNVATVAANNDPELGGIIADAFIKIGGDGTIVTRDSITPKTHIDVVMGTRIPSGFMSPMFINNRKGTCEFEDAYILIVDAVINRYDKGLMSILEQAHLQGKPVLIIAPDVINEALQFLSVNIGSKKFAGCAVKSPWLANRSFDEFEDIAIMTGGTVISTKKGNKLEGLELSALGRAEKVIVTQNETTIVGGAGSATLIEQRVEMLKNMLADEVDDKAADLIRERISKVSGGIGIIYVGANSVVESNEKKDRIDDAVRATKSAIEEGIVPGGGIAFEVIAQSQLSGNGIDTSKLSDNEAMGVDVVISAISTQLKRICDNAGVDYTEVLHNIHKPQLSSIPNYGYNAKTGEYGDMIEMGVIDPTKVVRCALENAASVASMVLISDVVVL